MKTQAYLLVLAITLLPQAAYSAKWKTNATAVVNDGVLPETQNGKSEPEKVARGMYDSIRSNSYYYDCSDEIKVFVEYVKEHKLETKFKKELTQDIPNLKKYMVLYKDADEIKAFMRANLHGLFTPREMEEALKLLKEAHAKSVKERPLLKSDHESNSKLIIEVQKNYAELRAKQLEISREKCEAEVDWTQKLPEQHSQTDTGWCYAFASSDLLSFLSGTTASAADLVLQHRKIRAEEEKRRYNKSAALFGKEPLKDDEELRIEYLFAGGEPQKVINSALQNGFCREEDFRSEAINLNGEVVAMGTLIKWMNSLGEDYRKGVITEATLRSKLDTMEFKKIFPNANLDMVLPKINKNTDLFMALGQNTCDRSQLPTNSIVVKKLDVSYTYTSDYLMKLYDVLNEGPAVISINDGFLYGKNQWGRKRTINHAVVVSGKRWNEETGHCEFKIRNSQTMKADKEEKEWYSDIDIFKNMESFLYTSETP